MAVAAGGVRAVGDIRNGKELMMTEKIGETLVRIETKLDAALEEQKDHEARIRGVEHSQWAWAGGAAVVSVVSSWLISIFKK